MFLEKSNGFLPLWGWALGRAALPSPGHFLVGKESGPPTLICVSRGLSRSSWVSVVAPGPSECEEWVLVLDHGDATSELDGKQLWITDRTF